MKVSSAFKEHLNQFKPIRNQLEEYFDSYKNSDKIIYLLEYWLFAVKTLIDCYGQAGIEAYKDSLTISPSRFAFEYEFNSKMNINFNPFKVQIYKLTFIFLRKLSLPGDTLNTIFSKIMNRVTQISIQSIPTITNSDRKLMLIPIIENYFNNESNEIKQVLIHKIPKVFYSNKQNIFFRKSFYFRGSAHSLMDFIGYEKILLLDTLIHIDGLQHGGGYDHFEFDYYSEFEKKISDNYTGWGFSEINEKQNKYKKIKVETQEEISFRRILWVERPNYPKFFQVMIKGAYLQYLSLSTLQTIKLALDQEELSYLSLPYPEPLRFGAYERFRKEDIKRKNVKSEEIIKLNDIVIFDVSAASLIHFCIENNIVFILIIDRSSEDLFTAKKKEWINLLRKHGLVFNQEQHSDFSKKLKYLLNKNVGLPEEVKSFNIENFFC